MPNRNGERGRTEMAQGLRLAVIAVTSAVVTGATVVAAGGWALEHMRPAPADPVAVLLARAGG